MAAEVGQFCRRVLLCRESVVHSDDPLIPGCTFYAGTPILLPGQDVCLGVLVVLAEPLHPGQQHSCAPNPHVSVRFRPLRSEWGTPLAAILVFFFAYQKPHQKHPQQSGLAAPYRPELGRPGLAAGLPTPCQPSLGGGATAGAACRPGAVRVEVVPVCALGSRFGSDLFFVVVSASGCQQRICPNRLGLRIHIAFFAL